MLVRIASDQARLGMYVADVGKSWLRSPFWRKRFLITDPDELALIANRASTKS